MTFAGINDTNMVIEVCNSMVQPCPSGVSKSSENGIDEQVKLTLEKLLAESKGSPEIEWDGEKAILRNVSPLTLHTFTLKAQELGKEVVLEKKTIIKVK